MKYLSEFFAPFDSFFETNILLISISFKLNNFLFLQKLCSFHSFLYLSEKNVKIFYNIVRCPIYTNKNYMVPSMKAQI